MSHLLRPYTLDALELKNSIVMPPMCMYKALEDGNITPFHLAHYGARAIGGVGLIIVEATAIEARGRISDHDLGLWDDEQIASHRTLVETCHQLGAKMAIQLAHAGRKSVCLHSTPVAPSRIAFSDKNGYKMPHELSLEEIGLIKHAFVQAALRATQAGYDALELHAAHGYLLCEFLSPLSNQREDAYGGTLEKRCALLLEITQAILAVTSVPLIIRLSADEWMDEGWSVDESIYLSRALKACGVSMIHVSAGGNHEHQTHIPPFEPLYQANYAKRIREEAHIPTIAVGLITTAEQGEKLLGEGYCDLVAYGRELLRNPNFVWHTAKAQGDKERIEPSYLRAF